jgi:uncharacterized membrane protein
MAGFFALVYGLYGLFRHWQFGSSAYDLGIFDQAIWHLSRLETPASSIRGFANILGDHFHPAIALFAPLYWVVAGPETLIVAQAVLFGASAVPLYIFLRRRLDRGPATAFTVAYGFFWGLQRAAAFDVHEIAFAPLLIATAIAAMDERRWGLFWFAACALIFVKEDLIPLLTFFGLYLVVHGDRGQGAGLVTLSLLAFVIVLLMVIPAMNESGQYGYGGNYGAILRRPWILPAALFTPSTKLETLLLWLLPFALLPLASPLSLLLVPFMLSRFLSDSPTHWGTTFHYTAPLAPILAMSAGDGLARIAARVQNAATRQRAVIGFSVASVILSLFLPGNQPFWKLFRPSYYQSTPARDAGYRALRLVPADASVVAQGVAVPHLSHREHIFILDGTDRDADFVIAVMHLSPWPSANADELRTHLDRYVARGYATTFDEHGWIVLKRTLP